MLLSSVVGIINSLLPEPQAGLLNGILFGVKATLDPQLKNSLTNSGTLYILAHSGLTISVLVSMVTLVLTRFMRRPIASMVSVAIIIGYVMLVGISASVVRAAIMAAISLTAVSFGRQNWPILAWILAVILMLMLNPPWIGDPSFQISVMASLGIILFGRASKRESFIAHPSGRLEAISVTSTKTTSDRSFLFPQTFWEKLRITVLKKTRASALSPLWSVIADDLRVSLAAQVFTVPIIMVQFHRISLVSPLSNVLIGWIIAPVTALGFVTVLAGLIWLPLGMVLGWFVWVPLTYMIWVINWTARLPFASVSF